MSDEKDPKEDQVDLEAAHAALEKLRPFMKPRQWPKVKRPGEDPELDKAVAEFLAPLPEEPVVQDLSIGMGNAKESAEAAPMPRVEGVRITQSKIKINIDDVPVELPTGSPTATTQQVDTREFQAARAAAKAAEDDAEATIPREKDDETTLAAAPKGQGKPGAGRTVGGRTERIPLVERPPEEPAGASPWTAEAPPPAVVPTELPSAHAPKNAREEVPTSASGLDAGRTRKRTITVVGAAVIGAALLIVLYAATNKPPENRTAATAAATSTVAPSVSVQAAPPPRSPAAPTSPEPTTSAVAPPEPTSAPTAVPSAAHSQKTGFQAPSKRRGAIDDPYTDASAPVAPPPKTADSVAPPVPPPPPKPTPPAAPTATSERIYD